MLSDEVKPCLDFPRERNQEQIGMVQPGAVSGKCSIAQTLDRLSGLENQSTTNSGQVTVGKLFIFSLTLIPHVVK